MDSITSKTWLQRAIAATRLRPQQVPDDIFYQYTRNQPYMIKSKLDYRTLNCSRLNRGRPLIENTKAIRLGSARDNAESKRKNYKSFDDSLLVDKHDEVGGSIMKKKGEIIRELSKLLQNRNTKEVLKKELQRVEAVQARKEYKVVSDRITLLTLQKPRSRSSHRMSMA